MLAKPWPVPRRKALQLGFAGMLPLAQ